MIISAVHLTLQMFQSICNVKWTVF